MRKKVIPSENGSKKQTRVATTPEARESQLIALATDLAEQQLRDGTASSQVITHYLKLGSTKERLEKELMATQKDYVEAKTESVRVSRQESEAFERMFKDVMDALTLYSGNGGE